MIYKKQNHIRFDRENNILYEVILNSGIEQSVPLFIFKQNFIDKKSLSDYAIEYLKRYMMMFPMLWQRYQKPIETNEQLSLF